MPGKFVLFGTQHLIVLALTVIVPLALAGLARWSRDKRLERGIAMALAAVLIGTWISWYVLFIARNWITLGNVFPLNLCDWATIAVLIALIRPNVLAFELAYFWSMAGTMQGLVTPDVNYGFPEAQFVVFMLGHAAIIASVIYLMAGTGLRPVVRSIPRAIGWSFVYAAVASLIDWLLGVNYGFFRAKPGHATAFDFLSDWPTYIPEMIAIGALVTIILYAPWFVADLVRGRPVGSERRIG
jgi:hypothetical integral membrane protein (TIGR02206 family)